MTNLANDHRTSWTIDINLDAFIQTCANAAADDSAFTVFRRSPYIQQVIETRPAEWIPLLTSIIDECGLPMEVFAIAAENDRFGSPQLQPVRGHDLSATTLSYAVDAAVIYSLFGSLDGMRVAEIGGGYGGLASILSKLWGIEYTIYDIPAVSSLQARFLQAVGCKSPVLRTEIEPGEFDLVISNCALSELSIECMNTYMNAVLRPSKRGYIGWNNVNSTPWMRQLEWAFGWLTRYKHPISISWGLLDNGHMKRAKNFAPYHFWWGA